MRKLEVTNELLLTEVTDLLRKGEQVVLKVKGNSMLPYIVGWRDSVKIKSFGSYSKFDVVLARTSMGVFVLHRIIDISADNVVLMGDGNVKGVEQCKLADISGRVIEVINGDKIIDYNTESVKRKGYIWYKLRPVRRYLLAIYRRVSKNYYKINK